MDSSDTLPERASQVKNARDYTSGEGKARVETGRPRLLISTRSLRSLHFAATGAWGFIAGVAGALAALAFEGKNVRPEGRGTYVLIPAILVAIAGSLVIAGAYQEAKRRRRS